MQHRNSRETSLPRAVAIRLAADERALASIAGANGSGMVVTDQRVIRWRPPGVPASLPLTSVERMKLNAAKPDRPATLVIVAADGRSPLSLSLEPHHVPAVGRFTVAMAAALKAAVEQMPQPVNVDQLGYGSLRVWAFSRDLTSSSGATR